MECFTNNVAVALDALRLLLIHNLLGFNAIPDTVRD